MIGLLVSSPLIVSTASSVKLSCRTVYPHLTALNFPACLPLLGRLYWHGLVYGAIYPAAQFVPISLKASSRLMISISRTGSTEPATWSIVLRQLFHMDNVNFPDVGQVIGNPSPWLAPLTKPATSTNSTRAGTKSCAEGGSIG